MEIKILKVAEWWDEAKTSGGMRDAGFKKPILDPLYMEFGFFRTKWTVRNQVIQRCPYYRDVRISTLWFTGEKNTRKQIFYCHFTMLSVTF